MSIIYPVVRLITLLGGIVFFLMAMNHQKADKQVVGTKVILNKEKVRALFVDEKGAKYYWISLSLFTIVLFIFIFPPLFCNRN